MDNRASLFGALICCAAVLWGTTGWAFVEECSCAARNTTSSVLTELNYHTEKNDNRFCNGENEVCNHCANTSFHRIEEVQDFDSAIKACSSYDSNAVLPVFSSPYDAAFISYQQQSQSASCHYNITIWIGARKNAGKKKFEWYLNTTDGDPVFSSWQAKYWWDGDHEDASSTKEVNHCLMMTCDGKFKSVECSSKSEQVLCQTNSGCKQKL